MERNNQRRVAWIDIAKGFGILTIIVFHTGFLPFPRLTTPLLNWMIVIFAFIGGYLYKPITSWNKFFIKKTRLLLLPYCLAGLISFSGWLYLRSHYPQGFLSIPIKGGFSQLLFGQGIMYNGPLWFLPTYFICIVVSSTLLPYLQKIKTVHKLIFIVLISLLSAYLISLKINFPYCFDISLLFVSFYLSGSFYKKHNVKSSLLLFVAMLAIFLATSYLNGTIDLRGKSLNNFLLFLVSSYSGIFVIMEISLFIGKYDLAAKRPFVYVGKNSLLLMAIHWPVIQWVSYGLKTTGFMDRIRAVPTMTSYLLSENDGSPIRLYVFFFLLLYLTLIFVSTFIITTLQKGRLKEFG